MSQPPPAPSLLASTHHLSTLLTPLTSPPPPPSSSSSASIPPAALLHPLGPSSPADVARLRTQARETLSHLRQSLSSFSFLALPSPSLSADEGAKEAAEKKRDRDKFLTLLRDSSQHETTLLSLRQMDASFAQSLLAARGDKYAGLYGALSPAEEEKGQVLKPLERLGRELGLAGFRDDEGSEGRQERVTLSLGGKVMVVDFEVVRGGEEGEAEEGQREKVEKVKVAYVPPGGADMLISARAGEVLLSLLSPTALSRAGAGEGEEQERHREDKQARWKAARRVLEQLKGLDEATEKTGKDCFKLMGEDLVSAAEEVFPTASLDPSSSTPSLFPSLLPSYPSSSSSPTTASLLPRLLLYASPPAQLSSSFRSFLTGSSSSTSSESPPEGVYTATLTLSALLPSPTAAAELGKEQGKEQEIECVALLDPPVPVTRETGRAICKALGIEVSSGTALGPGRGGARTGVGLEELLFGSAETAAEREWEVSFPTPSSSSTNPSSPAPHPLTITFRLAPHPYSSSSSAAPAPSFLATHLRFPSSSPSSDLKDRLLPALHLLEAQIRANELVKGVQRRSKVEAEGKKKALERADGEGEGEGRETKKLRAGKKLKKKEGQGEMTLDELFSDDPSSPPPPLPVYIHLSSPSPSPSTSSTASDAAWPPPTITLTFPVPFASFTSSSAVPPEARGLPMALTISSLPSSSSSSSPPSAPSYRVHVQAPPAVLDVLATSLSSSSGDEEEMDTDGAEGEAGEAGGRNGRRRRVKKLEEVLEVAGDLGLAVRWVAKKLT